jgi:hypothetical protein
MIIPHYINETKSDMRGIKPVRHAIEDDGNLFSGPFLSLEECVTKITPGCEPQEEVRPTSALIGTAINYRSAASAFRSTSMPSHKIHDVERLAGLDRVQLPRLAF